MKQKATVAVIVTGVLWGIISIFVKGMASAGLTLLQTVLIRFFFAGLVVAGVLLIKDRSLFHIHIKDLWMFVGTGIISLVIFNRCYMYTMTHDNAAVGAVLLYTSPVFIMLFSAVLFKEKITLQKIIALVLTFVGCALVSGLVGGASVSVDVILYGLGAGFFYSLYTIFGKVALKKYSSATVTIYTFLFAMLGSLPFAQLPTLMRTISAQPGILLWGLGLGIVCTAIPYFLYTWGLAYLDSGRAAIIVAVEPIVGAIVGMALYHEACNLVKIVGIVCVLTAILILNLCFERKTKCIRN